MKLSTLILIVAALYFSSTLVAQKTETLFIDWKDKKEWKEVHADTESSITLIEYLRKKEDLTNWTQMVAVQTIPVQSTEGVSLEALMNGGFSETQKVAPAAKLTLIDKDEAAENPWIEYKVEVSEYLSDPNPESQFFRVIKGKKAVFLIWWASRKDQITESEAAEWHEFFNRIEVQ